MMFSCTRANTSVAETTLPTPTTEAMMIATRASSMVAGKRDSSSCVTGVWV